MLGLSATPFSGKNTVKGIELMNFFGGQVFNLPIEAALEKGFLVKYYYYPIFVNATPDEEERFRKKSAQTLLYRKYEEYGHDAEQIHDSHRYLRVSMRPRLKEC